MQIVYLASPYTHEHVAVKEARFNAATSAAAELIKRGMIVYSPITMTHPIDVVLSGGVGTLGSDFWVDFDEAFMAACSEMVILTIPGWRESSGIAREIRYFQNSQKPISLMGETYQLEALSNEERTRLALVAG